MLDNNKPFFTVIVAVHRTEHFLEQCINSIKNQAFTNFECMVVNDGSPGVALSDYDKYQDPDYFHAIDLNGVGQADQAKTIFDKLVGNDPRFKYFYKEQAGTASVRNYAIEKATSEWICCVDSDDWILPDHLLIFADNINKNNNTKDIIPCFFGLNNYNTGYVHKINYQHKITLSNLLFNPIIIEWNFTFRKDIVDKYNVLNDERLGPGPKREDKIIAHGFDDLAFAWDYVAAVQMENNQIPPNFIITGQNTYMYRDVNSREKEKAKGEDVMVKFAEYMKPKALKHPSLVVKMSGILVPLHQKAILSKNIFVHYFLKKVYGFTLKLISRFYF